MKIYLFFLFIICVTAHAQEESYPPCASNPQLSDLLKTAKAIEHLALWDSGNKSSHGALCTSLLQPSKSYPVKFQPPADSAELESEELNYENEVIEWDCQYSPYNLSDGDTKTAWSEGVESDGLGEMVLARINERSKADIWIGYGKSEKLFEANNRPKKIRVYLLESNYRAASQTAQHYSDIKVLGMKEIVLKDFNGFQSIDLSTIPKGKPRKREEGRCDDCYGEYFFIGIEILSVYKGTLYRDTCISEIR